MMEERHISYDEMISYFENPIGVEENEITEEHLILCNRCEMELNVLEGLTVAIKNVGQISSEFIRAGKSKCLTNDELNLYANDHSNFEAKRLAVLHIAGCNKCLNDVFALKRLNNLLEAEPALIKKGLIISEFVVSHPTRITTVEDVGRDLIRQAALHGIAMFGMRKSFSSAFKGGEPLKDEHYVKIETEKFTIETLEILTEDPKVIIGITSKYDVKKVKLITCLSNKDVNEEIVVLKNKRAIVNKNDAKLDVNSYIMVEDLTAEEAENI